MKLTIFQSILLLAVSSLVGCATQSAAPVQFGGSASKILIRNTEPDADRYEPIGEVDCSKGGNFRSASTNLQDCRREMRVRADNMGGDVIVMMTESVGNGDCQNCVTLLATVWQELPEPEVEEPAEEEFDSQMIVAEEPDSEGADESTEPTEDEESGEGDVKARLKKLEELKAEGLISDEEYEAKRKQILDEL